MTAFSNAARRIQLGPGTLYWAPLGSAEPTSVSGAWPGAWNKFGYTIGGSTFAYTPTFGDVNVEEELLALDAQATDATASLTFNLAELTAQNLLVAYNAASGPAASKVTLPDGSILIAPPQLGAEERIMLGWDHGAKGVPDGTERLLIRQALQTGAISTQRQKGTTPAQYPMNFRPFVPGIQGTAGNGTGFEPFFHIKHPSLAA